MGISRRTQRLSNFPLFGISGNPTSCGQFSFSNSCNFLGETQFSFFVCSVNTQGNNFSGTSYPQIGCIDLCLDNSKENQAWLIKNNIIGAGRNINSTSGEYFSAEYNSVLRSTKDGVYYLSPANVNLYAKTKNDFNVCAEVIVNSGIRYKFYDSVDTSMKWTSKIEVIQTIYSTGEIVIPPEPPAIFTTGVYFSGTNQNWFDTGNWYADINFITGANVLPQKNSIVSLYGNCSVCINVDNLNWKEPSIINIFNITADPAICLTSSTGYIFSGSILSGNSTIHLNNISFSPPPLPPPIILKAGVYFSGNNQNWFDITNWYADINFSTSADLLPEKNSVVFLYGNYPACINVDTFNWKEPSIINILNTNADPAICLVSSTGYNFSGSILSGNSTIYLSNINFF